MLEDLLPCLSNVERCGDDAGNPAGNGAREKTVHEGSGVIFLASGSRSRATRFSEFREAVSCGFIAPPVDPAERYIAPHGEGQASP